MDSNQDYSFSVISMICGTLSIILCCTGVLSLPVGALGILFAVLTRRLDQDMPPLSLTGIALSCAGMILGLIMTVYAVYVLTTNPEYRPIWDELKAYYYEEFSDYLLEN